MGEKGNVLEGVAPVATSGGGPGVVDSVTGAVSGTAEKVVTETRDVVTGMAVGAGVEKAKEKLKGDDEEEGEGDATPK